MQVHRVIRPDADVELGRKLNRSNNCVDIITGPNGCGKTETLEALLAYADELVQDLPRQFNQRTSVHASGLPSKVVVQTFSPFTRFYAPRVDRASISDRYLERDVRPDSYVCVGLHRASRTVGASLSRKILEESLFRLSENPESAETLFSVLYELGFHTQLHLEYTPQSAFKKAFNAESPEEVMNAYRDKLNSRNPYLQKNEQLRREFDSENITDVFRHSVDVVMRHQNRRSNRRSGYQLFASLENARRDFHTIQAFALLRRLDVLSLTSCEISTQEHKLIDVAKTSSGQQQMLCAVLGLATSISNNCLVLVDEPELSLHPEWQLKFVDALFRIADSVHNAHIIVATHSPLIVQQGMQHGADIIQMGDRVQSSSRSLTDESLSVEQALIDVFHTPISGSAHVSNEIFQAVLKGETGTPAEKQEALAKLNQLRNIYRGEKDRATSELVREAIELINTNDDIPPNDDTQRVR